MQVVVVSAPGASSAPHWSHAFAASLGATLLGRGCGVSWLAEVPAKQPAPPAVAGVEPLVVARRLRPLHDVAASQSSPALELELTRVLREAPRSVVVHVGLGARSTPNVLWLADRLGSRVFACAKGSELVCARGDLVDRDGAACRDHADPARCRWCCKAKWRRRPHVSELQNRTDLLVAGLLVAERIFVPDAVDEAQVCTLGVPPHRVAVGMLGDDVAAGVLGAAAVGE